VTTGALITHAAWARTESRGCHSRLDFPDRDDATWRVRTVFQRDAEPRQIPVITAGATAASTVVSPATPPPSATDLSS